MQLLFNRIASRHFLGPGGGHHSSLRPHLISSHLTYLNCWISLFKRLDNKERVTTPPLTRVVRARGAQAAFPRAVGFE